jgi:hypothetical protein
MLTRQIGNYENDFDPGMPPAGGISAANACNNEQSV